MREHDGKENIKERKDGGKVGQIKRGVQGGSNKSTKTDTWSFRAMLETSVDDQRGRSGESVTPHYRQ